MGAPPSTWVAVRQTEAEILVVVGDRASGLREFARRPRTQPEAGYALDATDAAFDPGRSRVLVALCCEPVSGNIFAVDVGRRGNEFGSPTFQGSAVSIGGAPPLIATSDTAGTMVVNPLPSSGSPPRSTPEQIIRAQAGVSDVAVDREGNPPRVVGLVDPERIGAMTGTASRSQKLSLLVNDPGAGGWTERTIPLPDDAAYCRLVPLGRGRVGLLAGSRDREDPFLCTGTVLDVVDLRSGSLRQGFVTFAAPVQHLSADASGSFLIFVTKDGSIGWQKAGEAAGGLLAAAGGYVAADW